MINIIEKVFCFFFLKQTSSSVDTVMGLIMYTPPPKKKRHCSSNFWYLHVWPYLEIRALKL